MRAIWRDRLNRRVTLYEDTWQKKCAKHKELVGNENWLRQVVEAPDRVFQDADYSDTECLYRRGITNHSRIPMVKVVVKYRRRPWWRFWQWWWGGEVVSAYGCSNIKKKERQVWP